MSRLGYWGRMAGRAVHSDGGRGDPGGTGTVEFDERFDRDSLPALRAAVAAFATGRGAAPDRVTHLVIVVGELAANAVRHAGGTGRLRLWHARRCLWCEVADTGPGIADPAHVGTVAPDVLAPGGRGLWIVRRLAAEMRIDCGAAGTVVTAAVPLAAATTAG